jgi:7-cyano-7-deazaguanine synthase
VSKFIHLFSGGLDSTVLLYDLLDQGAHVHCLLFDYGQRHSKELRYAAKTCAKLSLPFDRIELPHKLFGRSSLTTNSGPLTGKATVVPNRNMVMLSMAASFALSCGGTAITWAVNADDEATYPDCRIEFYRAMNAALRICDNRRMEIHAPYLTGGKTKVEIVRLGLRLNVPFEETWSCYMGGDEPCGECGACKVRDAAIKQVSDEMDFSEVR